MSQVDKCVWLRKFIPPPDVSRFDSAFIGEPDSAYDRFRPLFLSQYFRPYAEYRKAALSLQFEDLSSVNEFVDRKIKVYQEVDGLSSTVATEKVFYELPLRLSEEFVRVNSELTKEKLLAFLTYNDFVIEAHYRDLTSRTAQSSLILPRPSTNQSNPHPVLREPAIQAGQINFQDNRLFLNLESSSETELEDNSEDISDPVAPEQSPVGDSRPASEPSSRKRAHAEKGVSVRKKKDAQTKSKRRR